MYMSPCVSYILQYRVELPEPNGCYRIESFRNGIRMRQRNRLRKLLNFDIFFSHATHTTVATIVAFNFARNAENMQFRSATYIISRMRLYNMNHTVDSRDSF